MSEPRERAEGQEFPRVHWPEMPTAGQVARYTLTPGILSRVHRLGFSGFHHLASAIALAYRAAGLLPPGHPYLMPQNVGQFGVRHVVAEAARRLEFRRERIDQVVIFFAVLLGLILMAFQVGFLVFSLLIGSASAQITPLPGTFFDTPDGSTTIGPTWGDSEADTPSHDIAFRVLDRVFGLTYLDGGTTRRLFFSEINVDTGVTGGLPFRFHAGLQQMFRIYNTAILLVGVWIFMYFIVVMIFETATTGVPFGQRFQHIWAPVRLVMAVALLMPMDQNDGSLPISQHMNVAQYITLITAKLGSGMASNAWSIYYRRLTDADVNGATTTAIANPAGAYQPNALGVPANTWLVGRPNTPDVMALMRYMHIVQTCAAAYRAKYNKTIHAYLVKGDQFRDLDTTPLTYDLALEFVEGGDVIVRFGEQNTAAYKNFEGHVFPYCGDLRISTRYSFLTAAQVLSASAHAQAVFVLQNMYYNFVLFSFWDDPDAQAFGERMAYVHMSLGIDPCTATSPGYSGSFHDGVFPPAAGPTCADVPDQQYVLSRYGVLSGDMETFVTAAYTNLVFGLQPVIDAEVLSLGWAGSGIWFNKIAEWNGEFTAAVMDVPSALRHPDVMEKVRDFKLTHESGAAGSDIFNPRTVSGIDIKFDDVGEKEIATALHATHRYWQTDDNLQPGGTGDGGLIFRIADILFGTKGIYNLRKPFDPNYDYEHPLVQMVVLGKGMMETAIRNLLIATGMAALGGALSIAGGWPEGFANALSGLFLNLTSIGITAGFVLYYLIPFMPFMYMFFALGEWVKTIFEAMVGVPLWALAHLRVDGEGIPGRADDGYFLIFEIFVRPVAAVFGLIASLAVFTALADVLNYIFGLVVMNATGFNFDWAATLGFWDWGSYVRGSLDEFCFSIMYVIIIYMMATSAFKLIDMFPDGVVRWMGNGSRSFGEMAGNQISGVVGYTGLAVGYLGRQVGSAATQFGRGTGALAGGAAVGGYQGLAAKLQQRTRNSSVESTGGASSGGASGGSGGAGGRGSGGTGQGGRRR